MHTNPPEPPRELLESTEHDVREAALDETIAGSFPASDPPSSLPNPADRGAIARLAKP